MDARTTSTRDFLAPIVDFALRHPARTLAIVLVAHFLVWTALPLLTAANLELDLAEDLALGKEWQLGYWKHPPLPWWLADLNFRLTGKVEAIYILSPLVIAACFVGVYLLARDMVGRTQALIASLSLVGMHYFNYSAVKFAHDQMQLPFWAFAALFLYRGLVNGRLLDWALAGVMLALAFWSKYAAFALAVSLALFLILDPQARRSLRTPGPWMMAAAFLVVIAPNAWWLVESGFLPFQYVTERARMAQHWYQYFTFPIVWTVTQAFFIHPALILLGLTLLPPAKPDIPQPPSVHFARRYAAMLAFGPFAVVTVVAALSGRAPIAMWGYPLWTFLPLAAVLWFGPVTDGIRLRIFAGGVIFLFFLGPAIFIGTYFAEQSLRVRPKATEFPGRVLAERLTREWRDATGAPLRYVAGTEFVANNVAVYAPERPSVVVHGRPKISPWIDMDDLKRKGVLVVWEDGLASAHTGEWRERFGARGEPGLLELPRQTRRNAPPVRIRYWIVPPAD